MPSSGTRTPMMKPGSVPSSRSASRQRLPTTTQNHQQPPPSTARSNPFELLFHVLEPIKATNSRLGPRLRHSLLKCDSLLLSGLEMVYMFIGTLLAMLVTAILLLALLVVLTAVTMPIALSLLLVTLRRRSGRMLARLANADRFAIVAVAAATTGAGVLAVA